MIIKCEKGEGDKAIRKVLKDIDLTAVDAISLLLSCNAGLLNFIEKHGLTNDLIDYSDELVNEILKIGIRLSFAVNDEIGRNIK